MVPQRSELLTSHIAGLKDFYRRKDASPNWATRQYASVLAHYYRHLIPAEASVLEIGCGAGELLARLPNKDITGIDLSETQIERAKQRVPHGTFYSDAAEFAEVERTFDYIIISDTLNEVADVQFLLERALKWATPETRIIINFHNTLWRPILGTARRLGMKTPRPPSSWLSRIDVLNLLKLAGWTPIRTEHRILWPIKTPLVERVLNAGLAPLLPWLNLAIFCVARPTGPRRQQGDEPSVSVVVPARNEAGNIEAAVQRTPQMGKWTELIFIEGNSTDDTWEEIQRVKEAYPDRRIRTLQQSGKGKGNAVREAFAVAEGDILMILDADLTMPPEELPKYVEVLRSGRGEFANGVRLVYPMEDEAMRFLNMCGNKTFSILFSWLLSQPVKDTLCGTKVMYREDYEKIAANRSYFGDFDPFGDFDLLFGASKLDLQIVDIPIRYRNRSYGDTNISRFRHGLLLFRMVGYASRKLKFI